MSAKDPITASPTTSPTKMAIKHSDPRRPSDTSSAPTADNCLTLADKFVCVVGLIQRKSCCCDQCKACGKCCLPDSDRDMILRKFNDTICTDRLERLGTYAQDFGDTKMLKRGENSIYIRPVRVRGEDFSVAYKLTVAQLPSPTSEARPTPDSNPAPESRLLRQISQG